jgi:hypothetical protein
MFEGVITELGSFELTGTVLRISDPCYDRDVWCCGTIQNCLPGTWEASILTKDEGAWGHRISALIARHVTGPKHTAINRGVCNGSGTWSICDFEVGVDSGQAGIFDDAHYQDNTVFEPGMKCRQKFGDLWYSYCCNLTLSPIQGGVLPFGAVASSGYGDGSYDCTIHKNFDGKVDFVFIVFISDDEDDEPEDDEE